MTDPIAVRRLVSLLRLVSCAAALGLAAFAAPSAAGTVGRGLAQLAAAAPDAPVAVWVTFADRAGQEHDPAALAAARLSLSPRARARRANRGVVTDVTAADLPVHAPYVRA